MPADGDHVIDDFGLTTQKMWAAVMQVGEYLARHQQSALKDAEIASQAQAGSLREVLEMERRTAESIYSQAHRPEFWEATNEREAARVYGIAKRFGAIDPQAALAARECEREAAERWNIDLAALQTPTHVALYQVRDVMPEVPGEQHRDWADVLEGARNEARAETDRELREAREARALAPETVEGQALVGAEERDVATAHATERAWDSVDARTEWAQALGERGHDPAAVTARVTADKGLARPPAELLRTSKKAVKKSPSRVASSVTQQRRRTM